MAYSTLNIKTSIWEFEVSPNESSICSPNINYICAPIDDEVKKNIISILGDLQVKDGESILVQFWAAIEIGNVSVLTTTCQPFGFFGNNQELGAFRKASLDYKYYVYEDAEKEVSFGLPGRVFLNCASVDTQNLHEYHATDRRPPCEVHIFTRKWGAFAMPVIHTNKCIGVLEFVMDTPRDSYNDDIRAVCKALEGVGLKSSTQFDRTRRTNIDGRVRLRKTKSFSLTKYSCLVPYFGLTSDCAAEKLGLKPGTFRNICRHVGIPVWPCIRNTTAIVQTESETSSFVTPIVGLTSILDRGFPGLSWEQPMTTIPSVRDTGMNQISFETSDTQAGIESERALPGFMPGCGEMINQHSNDLVMDDMDAEEHINIDYPNANFIIQDGGFPGLSLEQPMTTIPSVRDTGMNQISFETSDTQAGIESERALPGFMPGCGEMITQHSNDLVVDDMDAEEHINIDYPNANFIIQDGGFPGLSLEQPMTTIPSVRDTGMNQISFETSDTQAGIKSERALPGFMPGCGEMINQHSNIVYPNANFIIQDEGFPERPWPEIYNHILYAQQTRTSQNAFETSGDPEAWNKSTLVNEDPMDLFDFNSTDWIID